MSKKNKAFRGWSHQNPDGTAKDAWDAAWKNKQSTFHAKSMQKMATLQSQLTQQEEALKVLRKLCVWMASAPNSAPFRMANDLGRVFNALSIILHKELINIA